MQVRGPEPEVEDPFHEFVGGPEGLDPFPKLEDCGRSQDFLGHEVLAPEGTRANRQSKENLGGRDSCIPQVPGKKDL